MTSTLLRDAQLLRAALWTAGVCIVTAATAAPVRAETGVPTDTTAADVGDTAGTVSDVGDTSIGDVVPADATDVGDATDARDVRDGGDAADTAADDTGGDTGGDAAGDADAAGDTVGDAVDVPGDADTGVRFFGRVSVQFRGDDSGVSVALTRTGGDRRWERTTDAEGRFAFDGLPSGEYRATVSLQGYVTIEESFLLQGDRQERYRLLKDQDVELQVRALFPSASDVPGQVTFELDGERGSFEPDDPISVDDDNVATWKVDTVGVGNWTVTASAEGFQDVSLDFAARGPNSQADELDIRLYMRPLPEQPPSPDTSGCNCGDSDSGSGTPSPGPYAPPAIIVVFGCGLVAWRSLRREQTS